ncbi:hypothetical protein [Sorangium sp. So ce542]|uniref:hypothetical protein n=1 Tax=Sorangium sp. So ce542 TaxID=3133316 RepID=UPI003F5FB37F
MRIDGGPGGFAERTVSLTDLAWVIVARDDVGKNGGRLDEHRVNRLRYLEGGRPRSQRVIRGRATRRPRSCDASSTNESKLSSG